MSGSGMAKRLTGVGAITTVGGGITEFHGFTSGHVQRPRVLFVPVGGVVDAPHFVQSRRDIASPAGKARSHP